MLLNLENAIFFLFIKESNHKIYFYIFFYLYLFHTILYFHTLNKLFSIYKDIIDLNICVNKWSFLIFSEKNDRNKLFFLRQIIHHVLINNEF